MFSTPAVIVALGAPPVPGEVVGTDPWDDADDGTYARGSSQGIGGYHHITSSIEPATVNGTGLVVTFRVSATIDDPLREVRFVANLYPPGWESGDTGEPALNLQAGANPVYVAIPSPDGAIYDIETTVYDWVTETPATAAQVEAYFAAGGTLLIQPNATGSATIGVVTIHRISVPVVGDEGVSYRRIYPRDDRRNWPPPKAYSRGNRRGGGYL